MTGLAEHRITRERAASAAAVALFHGLLFYLLVTAFGLPVARAVDSTVKLFDLVEPPPPPRATPARPRADPANHKARTPNPEGAAAPRSLRNTPTEIVAPPPKIVLPVPPPLPVAPVAGEGSRPEAGASTLPGPGTGNGGLGTGTGSGRYGNGTGGGGGGVATRARWIRGAIRDSDYPSGALRAGAGGTVYLRFVVGADGRVSDCAVTRSSGRSDLDSATCRIIRDRFRYRPARDYAGRPIADTVLGQQDWELASGPGGSSADDEGY